MIAEANAFQLSNVEAFRFNFRIRTSQRGVFRKVF